jgi:hypothetical protein
MPAGWKLDDIFTPIGSEATKAIEELQRSAGRQGVVRFEQGGLTERARRDQVGQIGDLGCEFGYMVCQGASLTPEKEAGGGLQQCALIGVDLVGIKDEDTATFCQPDLRIQAVDETVEQAVQLSALVGALVIEYDHVCDHVAGTQELVDL